MYTRGAVLVAVAWQTGGPFTRLWATVREVEGREGLSRAQMLTLNALMARQGPGGELSRSSREIAQETGLSDDQVRRALSALCRKTFHHPDGREGGMILTRIAGGGNGRVAAFRLNVPQAWDGTLTDERA